ncbi:head GIN domain-containing protein [Pinibacter aurantiacus]|uniref:DUF2807 domain-containing protein n=1 Tax=Pinibacter aurantiacus TaxID=2851599 RepID=A0A9E2SDA0_9BACT|nr:head GIN domain-containing protein [Pinibacter aurantiacus]MBV4359484.1 DUF2807 domain-containing protein [Pinibacter aurantiacus]
MMKQISVIIASIAILFSMNACKKVVGEGPVVTQERTTSAFTALHSKISSDVFFSNGNEYKIRIEAQQNIIDVMETIISGSELQIRFRNDVNIKSHEAIRVYVTAPEVKSFTQSGSGTVNVQNDLTVDNLNLQISGSGNIKISKVEGDQISSHISGSGNIQVAQGTANKVNADISGSGNIDLINVLSKNASTTTSGSGGIKVYVTDNLDSRISGSGTVWYRGNPRVSANISGSGRVTPY